MKSEWVEAFQKHLTAKGDIVPKGWKTVKQISKESGGGYSHTSKKVRQLVKEGHAEKRKFRVVIDGKDTPYNLMHYRLK